jgi:hypothetical protein
MTKPIKLAVRYLLLALKVVFFAISYMMLLVPLVFFVAFLVVVFATGNCIWWCFEALLAWSYGKKPPPLRLLDGL